MRSKKRVMIDTESFLTDSKPLIGKSVLKSVKY